MQPAVLGSAAPHRAAFGVSPPEGASIADAGAGVAPAIRTSRNAMAVLRGLAGAGRRRSSLGPPRQAATRLRRVLHVRCGASRAARLSSAGLWNRSCRHPPPPGPVALARKEQGLWRRQEIGIGRSIRRSGLRAWMANRRCVGRTRIVRVARVETLPRLAFIVFKMIAVRKIGVRRAARRLRMPSYCVRRHLLAAITHIAVAMRSDDKS